MLLLNIVLLLSSLEASATVSKKVLCEQMYEIVSEATLVLLENKGMSLAEYTKSSVGKKATKYFPGEAGDKVVASTYLIANEINEDSLRELSLGKRILKNSGQKLAMEDLAQIVLDRQEKKINALTVDCVLNDVITKPDVETKNTDSSELF